MDENINYRELSKKIVENVGGASNIFNVAHCMTRLRLNLKDDSLINNKNIKMIEEIIGVTHLGGQYQIIIGQTVDKVYNEVISELGYNNVEPNIETTHKDKKISIKYLGNKILDTIAGSLTPLIPVLISASMFKMMASIGGPSMLNLISENSDLYKLFSFVGEAGFYFFPIMIGYTMAKKINTNPFLGMFLGGILLHPTLVSITNEKVDFSVYNIPIVPINYSGTLIPILLSVWLMSYIEKFLKKYTPSSLKTILVPFLTVVIMLPIMLAIIGPAGFIMGNYISKFLLSFNNIGGFLAIAIIAALYEFLVMTGMHILLITTLLAVFASTGKESLVSPAAIVASICVAGMALGVFLKLKNKNERSIALGFFVASLIGGVTEPALYGIGVRYKKPFIGLIIGGFLGGLYAGITGVTAYTLVPVASFLAMTGFFGGSMSNTINGVISCLIGFVSATLITYILTTNNNDKIVEGD